MEWHKIELSSTQMANNEVHNIQNKIVTMWIAAGGHKGFAVFHSKSNSPFCLYFSPIASEECIAIISEYNGVKCNAPNHNDVGFFTGDASDSDMLR